MKRQPVIVTSLIYGLFIIGVMISFAGVVSTTAFPAALGASFIALSAWLMAYASKHWN